MHVNNKPPLIILTGPTAVGKTSLSVKLAKRINGEIISADSMQVYRHMDIGTAKIMPEEMNGVKHYLIDELEPNEEFNVVKFKSYADKYLDEIYRKEKIPIIVGGTGFYIQAVLYQIDFTKTEESSNCRKELEQIASQKGACYLHNLLKSLDPESAAAIHPNNTKRVIRAIEYYRQTGAPISAHNKEQRKKESPFRFAYFVLNRERNFLYEQINQRVDQMLEQGLVEEVKTLKNMGYTKELISMQGLGYKELLEYLDKECSLEEAVYKIKRDTRHFAKRQITWFKREKDIIWIEKEKYNNRDEQILDVMVEQLKNLNIIE